MSIFRAILSHVLITLAGLLAALGAGWLLIPPDLFSRLHLLSLGWIFFLAASVAALLGWLASRAPARRLHRLASICQAWLRGDLTVRLSDPASDDLGRLARQLDQLAAQFAREEQDLAELRLRETRLTDQVRALSVVEERNRLARDLHDGVKQDLFSFSMTLSAIQERLQRDPGCMAPELADMVAQMKITSQSVQSEMARLIDGLRPASLQERGLALALNDFCLLFGAREHLLIYLDIQGDAALLPPSAAETLYVIAQESLANTARHARATRVDVKLNILPELVILSLRDNGAGFDQTSPHTGMGLSNMQERLLTLGGRLTIESQPGLGTLVTAEVGLARPLPASPQIDRLEEDRPLPEISNWTWLGQKLVIPVGQTWPWRAEDELCLRGPLVECTDTPLQFRRQSSFPGFGEKYLLQTMPAGLILSRLHCSSSGADWRLAGARWSLRKYSGGRAVLSRNGQPLAAIQIQGRQMNKWTEILYAGYGYRLRGTAGCMLTGENGEELLQLSGMDPVEIRLVRPVPLPLLNLVLLRYLDERREASSSASKTIVTGK